MEHRAPASKPDRRPSLDRRLPAPEALFPIPRWELRYGVAVVLVVLAWLTRDALFPGAAEVNPFMAFGLAVLSTALIAGFGPGLLASFLSSLIATYFYLSPRHDLLVHEPYEIVGLGLFIVEGLVAALAGGLVRRSLLREQAVIHAGDRVSRFLQHAERARGSPMVDRPSIVEALSGRELEVGRLLARGLANDEIAAALFVSRNTVKTHLKNLYGKLGVRSRTEAVARLIELGLLTTSQAEAQVGPDAGTSDERETVIHDPPGAPHIGG